MRISTKGQVTIPKAIRDELGLLPHTEVRFVVEGDTVRIVKEEQPSDSRGGQAVARLRGAATVDLTTDEILALTRDLE